MMEEMLVPAGMGEAVVVALILCVAMCVALMVHAARGAKRSREVPRPGSLRKAA
jgi:hypothetical protein